MEKQRDDRERTMATQVQDGLEVEVDSPFSKTKVGREALVGVKVTITNGEMRTMDRPRES